MNKRELRDAVRSRNGITATGDGLAGHTDIDACITAALRDLSEHTWPWLLTSAAINFTAGTGTIPADCSSIRVLMINGLVAKRGSLDVVLGGNELFTWTEDGANLLVYPAATITQTTQTAVLHYWRAEPEPTTDDSIPLTPVQWHQVIVARASYHLNVRRGISERVAIDSQEYLGGMKRMESAGWRTTGPRMIRDGFRTTQVAHWSTT